jgi:hypothetical protein
MAKEIRTVLDTSSLRTVDSSFLEIKNRLVTLVLFRDGKITQAISVGEKRGLISQHDNSSTLLAVWTGQWSSDVFGVPDEYVAQWRKDLGLG